MTGREGLLLDRLTAELQDYANRGSEGVMKML